MHYITFALIFVTWAGLDYLFFNSKKLNSYQLLLLSKLSLLVMRYLQNCSPQVRNCKLIQEAAQHKWSTRAQ